MDNSLDNWLGPQADVDNEKEELVVELEEAENKRKSQWELLKEEIIGQIKVVIRKNKFQILASFFGFLGKIVNNVSLRLGEGLSRQSLRKRRQPRPIE